MGRAELERLVQLVDRKHPDWSSRKIESELEILAPVSYGNWRENTQNLAARLRQVQRWRRGASGQPAPKAGPLPFPLLWPIGERQRAKIDPEFAARPTTVQASHRIFLYNCSAETVRSVRILLGGREVAYEPAIAPGKFAEVFWQKNSAVRAGALAAASAERIPYRLHVQFAVAKGTKRANLEGHLTLDASFGWISFTADDGQQKEIE